MIIMAGPIAHAHFYGYTTALELASKWYKAKYSLEWAAGKLF